MGDLRALVVDDELHVRILMKNVVSRLGGRVVAMATDGDEAVALFREHRPNLVLLDIRMARVNGDEALAEIAIEDPEARVIMLTASSDRETVERCRALGAAAYVRKDTLLSDFVEAVQAAISEPDEAA